MAPWDVSFLNPELGLICETVLCWDTRLYLDILLQLGQLSRRQSQAWQPVSEPHTPYLSGCTPWVVDEPWG